MGIRNYIIRPAARTNIIIENYHLLCHLLSPASIECSPRYWYCNRAQRITTRQSWSAITIRSSHQLCAPFTVNAHITCEKQSHMAYPADPTAGQCFWIVARTLPLANAAAESSGLDNSPGNTDNQILGTRSLTRVSILVRLARPFIPRAPRRIQNTCGAYLHTYLTNYHSQYLYRTGERIHAARGSYRAR